MKNLFILIFLAFCLLSLGAQTPCSCTYPLKANTCWTEGPKGGKFCINRNGNKTYKKKETAYTYNPSSNHKSKFTK